VVKFRAHAAEESRNENERAHTLVGALAFERTNVIRITPEVCR
jgi:hypothetical protein